MFEITDATCVLENLNPRPEIHGESPKPAADLKISYTMSNDDLALFHPALKSLLYQREATEAKPDDLVDKAEKSKDPNRLPHLRMPKLGALKYDDEVVGAEVTIDYGVKNPITLAGCNVNNFTLEPQEGGSVTVTFRIQAHPSESAVGKLYLLMGNTINLTIEPPRSTEKLTPAQRKKKARGEADAAFH